MVDNSMNRRLKKFWDNSNVTVLFSLHTKKLLIFLEDLKRTGVLLMLVIVAVLSIVTHAFCGDLALHPLSLARWTAIATATVLFLLISTLVDLFCTFTKIKHFTDPETGNVNLPALWKDCYTLPYKGIIIIIIMTFGITCAQSFSEYYRQATHTWHDPELWLLEESLFSLLKGSYIDIPILWDYVYFMFWPFLMLVFCVLYRMQHYYDLSLISIATVLCYFQTRLLAIMFPTAGPVFYKADAFNLSGTLSAKTQSMLMSYMQGDISQNGLIPGTMGMPSLHIGVTAMAAWFLARRIVKMRWLLLIWVFLTWIATLILGWHYAIDGIGGIAVAVTSVLAARWVLSFNNVS